MVKQNLLIRINFNAIQLARPASWRSLGDQTPAKATLHRHGAGWDFGRDATPPQGAPRLDRWD